MEAGIPIGWRIIFAAVCAKIASKKGRSVIGWVFGGFFLGLIGLIIVCCLSVKDN